MVCCYQKTRVRAIVYTFLLTSLFSSHHAFSFPSPNIGMHQLMVDAYTTALNLYSQVSDFLPEFITTATIIDFPGSYMLTTNIAGQIIIASNDVSLNLNGHFVDGSTSGTGIVVESGYSNVSIYGGIVQSSANSIGIYVSEGCMGISIDNITLEGDSSPSCYGIYFNGSGPNILSTGSIYNIFALACGFGLYVDSAIGINILQSRFEADGYGIYLNNCQQSLVEQCEFRDCWLIGINDVGGYEDIIENCRLTAMVTATDNDVFGCSLNGCEDVLLNAIIVDTVEGSVSMTSSVGFDVSGGSDNRIQDCLAKNVHLGTTNHGAFLVRNGATRCYFVNNNAQNCDYGFYDAIAGSTNVFAENLASSCTTAYTGITTATTGFGETRFMYNIALP